MKSLDFSRCALTSCVAAAMLAGCGGGSGTALSPSPAEMTAERMRPSVTYKVLYSFKGYPYDGEEPHAGLINVEGTLYGTTVVGGAKDYFGTVFAITPPGTETVLYSFNGKNGSNPEAGLLNVNGTLYGTTSEGGSERGKKCYQNYRRVCGTVFAITPSGTETVLYSFKGGSGDGDEPTAGLLNVKGTLYGTTPYGGANYDGTVFSLSP